MVLIDLMVTPAATSGPDLLAPLCANPYLYSHIISISTHQKVEMFDSKKHGCSSNIPSVLIFIVLPYACDTLSLDSNDL